MTDAHAAALIFLGLFALVGWLAWLSYKDGKGKP